MCKWCTEALRWLSEEVWERFTDWVTQAFKQCSKRKCKWWCACCNKWFCWIALILLAIIVFILYFIVTLVVGIVCVLCFIVCGIICIIGTIFGRADWNRCTDWCSGKAPDPGDIDVVETPKIPHDVGSGLTGGGSLKDD